MDTDELVTVYTVANPIKAEIIKNYLEDEGIQCFLDGVNQAAEPGLIALSVKVQVRAEDAVRAREALEGHDAGEEGETVGDEADDEDDENEEVI